MKTPQPILPYCTKWYTSCHQAPTAWRSPCGTPFTWRALTHQMYHLFFPLRTYCSNRFTVLFRHSMGTPWILNEFLRHLYFLVILIPVNTNHSIIQCSFKSMGHVWLYYDIYAWKSMNAGTEGMVSTFLSDPLILIQPVVMPTTLLLAPNFFHLLASLDTIFEWWENLL